MDRNKDTRRSLPWLITSITFVVFFAASTIGLLSHWFLQSQLEQQVWLQVEQGQRAAIALHSVQYQEILNLAGMTAQRPTLQNLLSKGDISALTNYLVTLKDGANLTRIIICDPEDRIIATTDDAVLESVCQKWKTGNYQYNPQLPQACLTAHQPIKDGSGKVLGEVYVCNQLDKAFTIKISEETGLEHTLWIDDVPVSTSFNIDITELTDLQYTVFVREGRTSRHIFEVGGVLYYSADLPLEEAGLRAEVALDVTEYQKMRTQLVKTMVISVIGVTFIGSSLGVYLVRRSRHL
jgi:hypothetical protein